jgi:hypothetical protein
LTIDTTTTREGLRHAERIGGINITAICAPPSPEASWSLKDMYSQEAVDDRPQLARGLSRALLDHGITRAYAPSVAAMSGAIAERHELSTALSLPEGVTMLRNKALPSDGVPLNPESGNEGFVMSGGGCPLVVAIGGGHVIAAHASRESLIDRGRIETGTPSRDHESVIHSIAAWFQKKRVPVDQVNVRIFFTVKAKAFPHPFTGSAHSPYNQKLHADIMGRNLGKDVMQRDTGRLSIPGLIHGLCAKEGFATRRVLNLLPLPTDGAFAYTRHQKPHLASARNLVMLHVSN